MTFKNYLLTAFIFISSLAQAEFNLSSEAGVDSISFNRALKIYSEGIAPKKKQVTGEWIATLFVCLSGLPNSYELGNCRENPQGYRNPDGSLQSIEIISRSSDWTPEKQFLVFWNNLGDAHSDQGPYPVSTEGVLKSKYMLLPRYGYTGSRINKSIKTNTSCRHPQTSDDLLICKIRYSGTAPDPKNQVWYDRDVIFIGFKRFELD